MDFQVRIACVLHTGGSDFDTKKVKIALNMMDILLKLMNVAFKMMGFCVKDDECCI